MHQASLLASEQNPIDQVLAQFLEILNVNDVNAMNQSLEALSQIHYDKIRAGQVRKVYMEMNDPNLDTQFSERQREFLQIFMDSIKLKEDFGYAGGLMQDDEITKHSLYEVQHHLLFADYLLKCLKARDAKTRLLYTLNAFRSLQKRIALELRQLNTRDRVNLDTVVQNAAQPDAKSVFEQDVLNEELKKMHGRQGEQLPEVDNVIMQEMVDIGKYRFKGLLQNQMWSTCPVLPKFHSSFGEPIERQEVSTEFEVSKSQDPRKDEALRLLGRIDFITKHQQSNCYMVKDDFNVNLIYDATFADMRALEQEMLKVMSYYVNRNEPIPEGDFRKIVPMVDRFKLIQ